MVNDFVKGSAFKNALSDYAEKHNVKLNKLYEDLHFNMKPISTALEVERLIPNMLEYEGLRNLHVYILEYPEGYSEDIIKIANDTIKEDNDKLTAIFDGFNNDNWDDFLSQHVSRTWISSNGIYEDGDLTDVPDIIDGYYETLFNDITYYTGYSQAESDLVTIDRYEMSINDIHQAFHECKINSIWFTKNNPNLWYEYPYENDELINLCKTLEDGYIYEVDDSNNLFKHSVNTVFNLAIDVGVLTSNHKICYSEPKIVDLPEYEVAITVGKYFSVVDERLVEHIKLVPSGCHVSLDGKKYELMKAQTYEESRRIDDIMDTVKEYQIIEHEIKNHKNKGR